MKFKKTALFAAALAVCASAFTGCGDDSSTEEIATTTSQTQSETTTADQISEENNSGEETEISREIDSGEQNPADSVSGGGILSEAADAALEGAPWPAMEKLEDPEFVSDFFLLDMGNENYRDILILKCPMSANLSEIIIIEADDVSAAQTDLEARRKKAQEQDAWYPDDVEKAGASIVGTEGSYAYFIMGADPQAVESALVDYLKSAG